MTITIRPHSTNKPIKTTYFHLTWIGLYLVVALWFRAPCFGGLRLMWRKLWWGLCCTPRSIPCPRWLSPGTVDQSHLSKPCSLYTWYVCTVLVSPGRCKLFLEWPLAQYNLFLSEPAWLKSEEIVLHLHIKIIWICKKRTLLFNTSRWSYWIQNLHRHHNFVKTLCRIPYNYSHFDPGSASLGYCQHKLGWVTILARKRWPRWSRPAQLYPLSTIHYPLSTIHSLLSLIQLKRIDVTWWTRGGPDNSGFHPGVMQ